MGANKDEFVCRDCHKKLPVSESVKDASRKRGIMERCKPCDRDRKAQHRQDNAEAVRVKVRDANKVLRRERKAAGMHWSDNLTDEQVAAKRAWSRRYAREKRWASLGASPEYYAQQFEAQGGRCNICGTDRPTRGRNGTEDDEYFCIDHDHETGQLRGLLCKDCNSMIGHAWDDPERLSKGIEYLARWSR